MKNKQAVAASLLAALLSASATATWAGAPASPLAQTQSIMGSQTSPDVKLGCLYNGGCSSQQLGAAPPVQAQASVSASGRSLDIGAAPAPASGLDRVSVPSPSGAAAGQARVGFWGSSVEEAPNGAVAVGIVLVIGLGIALASRGHQNASPYQQGYQAGQSDALNAPYNAGQTAGYQSGYNAGVADNTGAYNAGYQAGYQTGYSLGNRGY